MEEKDNTEQGLYLHKREKTGGRVKGSTNKIKGQMRERILEFINDNFEEFEDKWKTIKDPEKKCKIYIEMTKFVVPALSSVSLEANDENKNPVRGFLIELRDSYEEKKDGKKKREDE